MFTTSHHIAITAGVSVVFNFDAEVPDFGAVVAQHSTKVSVKNTEGSLTKQPGTVLGTYHFVAYSFHKIFEYNSLVQRVSYY